MITWNDDYMEYRVLGSLDIVRDDGRHAVFRHRERQLVAVLLVFPGDPCSRDMLIRAVWQDTPPATPERALRTCLFRARTALGPGGCLRTLDDGALLADPGEQDLDLARFLRLHSAALQLLRRGDLLPASEALEQALACWHDPPLGDLRFEQALACWRNPPLPDLPDAFEVAARRTRLLEQRRLAWLTLADVLLELGDYYRILPHLRARVIADPICEHAWVQLMLALHRSGRDDEALAVYSKARGEIIRTLGTEPGAELQDLREHLRAGTPGASRYARPPAERRAALEQAAARI
jgi:DNA-binding SARP family transcriptional activator